MLVSSAHRQFRIFNENEEDAQSERYLDLCILWRRKKTGEILYRGGGRWDKVERCWSKDEPRSVRIIDLQESQIHAARWAAWWLQEFKAGRPRDFFALFLMGGRGAGKTFFASIFLVSFIIDCPFIDGTPTIAWQVSASHAERDELDRELENNFPFKNLWYKYVEHPKHEYRFIHGPRITNVSADDAEDLKRGRVDFLLLNEAQKMRKKVPAYGIARLKDKGGMTVFTFNPPQDSKARWLFDVWEHERELRQNGQSFPIRFVEMKSEDNDTLDKHVEGQISEVIRFMDPRLAAADIDGLMLRIDQPAYWEFQKARNIRKRPDLGDITREFTQKRTGRAYDYIGGADFQGTPHMAAAIFKVYGTIDTPILWGIDEFVAEQATEDDLLDLVDEAGYAPETLLWIGDASGQWQDGRHSRNGRDSFAVFKSRRWHILPPVKPKNPTHRPKNPLVEQRVKLINQLFATKTCMVDAERASKLVEAFKECELRQGKFGKVHPYGFYAHLTDAAGYVCWWAYPKPTDPDKKNQPLGIIFSAPKLKAI